jgi:hypothetical protein
VTSDQIDTIVGAGLIVIAAVALFILAVPLRGRVRRIFRVIPGIVRLRRAIGLTVENGRRLHVSLGEGGLTGASGAVSLAALSTLDRIAALSMISDRPPIATSGEGSLSILSQDELRSAYRDGNALEQYDRDRGRLGGVTPLSYAAGTLPVIRDEQVSANILVGNFGSEIGLMTDAAYRQQAFVVAASDSLPAQAVIYAAAEEPLIGEELFSVPAYLQAGPFHVASLQVQDILRWVVIALILGGIILKLLGVSLL